MSHWSEALYRQIAQLQRELQERNARIETLSDELRRELEEARRHIADLETSLRTFQADRLRLERELEEARFEHHRCDSCGLWWQGPAGAEMCGDCWRRTHPGGIPTPPEAWRGTCGHVWMKTQSEPCPICEAARLREQLAAVPLQRPCGDCEWTLTTPCERHRAALSALHGAEPREGTR